MQESLVKLVLIFTALASIVAGAVLLVIPGWFVETSGITAIDVGWLRSIGASVIGVQGFGLLIAAFRRRDTNPLVGIVSLVTTFQAGALWYSLFAGEYGEMSRWAIVVPAILATIAGVFLWLIWAARRTTVGGLPAKGERHKAEAAPLAELEEPGPPAQEMADKIDADSPRLNE